MLADYVDKAVDTILGKQKGYLTPDQTSFLLTEEQKSRILSKQSARGMESAQIELEDVQSLYATEKNIRFVVISLFVSAMAIFFQITLRLGNLSVFIFYMLVLFMALSPWGTLLLDKNKPDQLIFYVVEETSAFTNEEFVSRKRGRWFFLLFLFVFIALLAIVDVFGGFYESHSLNLMTTALLFVGWDAGRNCHPLPAALFNYDKRSFLKKIYSIFAKEAFLYLVWWFSFALVLIAPQGTLSPQGMLMYILGTHSLWFLSEVCVTMIIIKKFIRNVQDGAENHRELKDTIRIIVKAALKRGLWRMLLFQAVIYSVLLLPWRNSGYILNFLSFIMVPGFVFIVFSDLFKRHIYKKLSVTLE